MNLLLSTKMYLQQKLSIKEKENFFLVSTEQTKDERGIEENKSRKQILFTYTEVDMKESETPLRFKM